MDLRAFESLKDLSFDRVLPSYAWAGHLPFAYYFVQLLKPRLVVELGTYKGNSLAAFSKSIKDASLDTECIGIDAWEGDLHMGVFDNSIYEDVQAFFSTTFPETKLVRSYFDDAVEQFEDGSIDLLHIDGLHTYEAVKNDFETWLPKLSDRGVTLFHDTMVRKRKDFGVYKYWQEISGQYKTFNFRHSLGLGVVAVGRNVPGEVNVFLDYANKYPGLTSGVFLSFAEQSLPKDAFKDVEKNSFVESPYQGLEKAFDIQLFLDYGSGFSEEDSVRRPIDENRSRIVFEFDLNSKADVKSIRFDPADTFLIMKDLVIELCDSDGNRKDVEIELHNATQVNNGTYSFFTYDPSFILDIKEHDLSLYTTVCFSYEVVAHSVPVLRGEFLTYFNQFKERVREKDMLTHELEEKREHLILENKESLEKIRVISQELRKELVAKKAEKNKVAKIKSGHKEKLRAVNDRYLGELAKKEKDISYLEIKNSELDEYVGKLVKRIEESEQYRSALAQEKEEISHILESEIKLKKQAILATKELEKLNQNQSVLIKEKEKELNLILESESKLKKQIFLALKKIEELERHQSVLVREKDEINHTLEKELKLKKQAILATKELERLNKDQSALIKEKEDEISRILKRELKLKKQILLASKQIEELNRYQLSLLKEKEELNQYQLAVIQERDEEISRLLKSESKLTEQVSLASEQIDQLNQYQSTLVKELEVASKLHQREVASRKIAQDEIVKLGNMEDVLRNRVKQTEDQLDKAQRERMLSLYNHCFSKLDKFLLRYFYYSEAEIKEIYDSGYFDSQWYLNNYKDVSCNKKHKQNPLKHYLYYGSFEGYEPSATFSGLRYLLRNPDLLNSRANPLAHYVLIGQKSGRRLK